MNMRSIKIKIYSGIGHDAALAMVSQVVAVGRNGKSYNGVTVIPRVPPLRDVRVTAYSTQTMDTFRVEEAK